MGNKRHFKKGDTVYILSGEERGASGKVIDVLTSSGRVVVEGLSMVKKHIRKNRTNRRVKSPSAREPSTGPT